jgi:ribosome-binding protein aMBF1 (putative translation factor)
MFLSSIPKNLACRAMLKPRQLKYSSPKTVELEELFGRRLRQLRKRKGWTQEKLAEKSEMSIDQIGHLERGNATTFDTLKKLAPALDIEVKDLFDFSELSG